MVGRNAPSGHASGGFSADRLQFPAPEAQYLR
jgi:hypothetical protein